MSVKMKALKDFRGEPGEGNNRMVEAGGEIDVSSEQRARLLEARGLAVPIISKAAPRTDKTTQANVENKAATSGPLASPGGGTGAVTSPSSSPVDPAPRMPRSPTSRGSRGS